MKTFDFTIYLDTEDLSEEDVDKLYEAGCNDATIGRILGRCQAAFDREGESLEAAIQSAIDDIQSAGFRVAQVETEESVTVELINQRIAVST